MKSLEFINKDLQDFEKTLENYKKRKAINNEEVDEEYIKQMTKEIENYKQIKQDLEVLEILREHLVLIPTGTNKEQLFIATDITNYLSEKDKEKFNKVKQWLEVNE